ncbi:hypothetical protein CGZ69_35300 [Streptomyces peucetius subsp. caesius ATCC 27952]|nr:hypothetical protein CGZ69_35300 [Streptomyces peucetius subsp. caesius ATCC 27952]
MLAAIPEDRRETIAGDRFTGNPLVYLTNHFTALRDFYVNASQQAMFVVLWWGLSLTRTHLGSSENSGCWTSRS